MNLYLISQNKHDWYDTYSDAVVCAVDEDEARRIHPDGSNKKLPEVDDDTYSTWAGWSEVKVEFIGTARLNLGCGVICSSFHSG